MARTAGKDRLKKQPPFGGFAIIEFLVAMVVFSVAVLAVTGIFVTSIGGTKRIFGQQVVQESGRFILESMSKEIRMSRINSAGGVEYTLLDEGSSGPYASLSVTTPNNQIITYSFDSVNKQISRAGSVLTPNDIEVVGDFYLTKNGTFPPRVTIALKLNNKVIKERERVDVNLQTTASSRYYIQDTLPVSSSTNLVLTHLTNRRSFSVSWTASEGDNGGEGGCKLQFSMDSCNWVDIDAANSVNCDADSSHTFDLNDDGWKNNWNGTQVRLTRRSDLAAVSTFPEPLVCDSLMLGSNSATPEIDEDCNGIWDNKTVLPTSPATYYDCTIDTAVPNGCIAYQSDWFIKAEQKRPPAYTTCSNSNEPGGVSHAHNYKDYKNTPGSSAAELNDLNRSQCESDISASWTIFCDDAANILYTLENVHCSPNGTYTCTYPVLVINGCQNYTTTYY